jgi:hypothetical protein
MNMLSASARLCCIPVAKATGSRLSVSDSLVTVKPRFNDTPGDSPRCRYLEASLQ